MQESALWNGPGELRHLDEVEAANMLDELDYAYPHDSRGDEARSQYLEMMLEERWHEGGAWYAVKTWTRTKPHYPKMSELRGLYQHWVSERRALHGMPVVASVGIEALPVPVVDTGAMWRDFWAQLLSWASLLRSIADAQQRQELWERRQLPLSPEAQAKWREMGHRLGKYKAEE